MGIVFVDIRGYTLILKGETRRLPKSDLKDIRGTIFVCVDSHFPYRDWAFRSMEASLVRLPTCQNETYTGRPTTSRTR